MSDISTLLALFNAFYKVHTLGQAHTVTFKRVRREEAKSELSRLQRKIKLKAPKE